MAGLTPVDYWEGLTGTDFDNGKRSATDGTYLYVCNGASPSEIAKIRLSDWTLMAVWTGETGQNACVAIAYDNPFLYAAFFGEDAKVAKIQVSSMETVATWGPVVPYRHISAIAAGGEGVYIGFSAIAAPEGRQVLKINSASMTTGGNYEDLDASSTLDLLYESGYVYASMSPFGGGSETRVLKINVATMGLAAVGRGPVGTSGTGDRLAYGVGYIYASWQVGIGTWAGVARFDLNMNLVGNIVFVGINNLRDIALTCTGGFVFAGLDWGVDISIRKINPATMGVVATWIKGGGDDNIGDLESNGSEIYAILNLSPTRIPEIRISDMTNTNLWTGAPITENHPWSLASDGTYIYAGLIESPAKIVKLTIDGLDKVDLWEATGNDDWCMALVHDGTFLYASVDTWPPKIFKINTGTMATVDDWTGIGGDWSCYGLAWDGAYIYGLLDNSPAKVVKIDPATMATVDTWEAAAADQEMSYGLIYEDPYLYALILDDNYAALRQIDPITMTTVDSWSYFDKWEDPMDLVSDGTFVYVGIDSNPARVDKVEISSMTTVDNWTGASSDEKYCRSVALGGGYLFAGLATVPASIAAIDPSDMSAVDIWEATSGHNYCRVLMFDDHLYAGLSMSPGILYQLQMGIIKYLITAAIDASNRVAYFGAYLDPGMVAKIELWPGFRLDDILTMDVGDAYPRSSICSPFFNVFYGLNLTPGRMVDVEIPGFTQDSNQLFGAGQAEFWAAGDDPAGGMAYFSCRRDPGIIVRISRGDYTVNATLTLAAGDSFPRPIGIDHDEDYAFVGLWTSPAEIVVIKLSTFLRQIRYQIPADINYLSCGVCDTQRNWMYFGAYMAPGKIIRVKYGS